MSILVTGGYGLIGSTADPHAGGKRGESLRSLTNGPLPSALPESPIGSQTIQGDLGNFSKVLEAVKESAPQTIFHLGGMLSLPSNADPQSAYSTNVAGTYHVLEAARLFQVPKVIFHQHHCHVRA